MHPHQCFKKIRDRQNGGAVITTLQHDIIYYLWQQGLRRLQLTK